MIKYLTVEESSQVVDIIKKSKFHGFVFSCDSVKAFEEKVAEIKNQYPGASHYCYAYRIKEQILMERYNDDKEPSGSAGMPILDVLRGKDLEQCGALVVRFFGGTKLGTGGLSRAYSGSIIHALNQAGIVSMESGMTVNLSVDYGLSGKVEYWIGTHHIPLVDTRYDSGVTYQLVLRTEKYDQQIGELRELTNGQGKIYNIGSTIGCFKDNGFTEG